MPRRFRTGGKILGGSVSKTSLEVAIGRVTWSNALRNKSAFCYCNMQVSVLEAERSTNLYSASRVSNGYIRRDCQRETMDRRSARARRSATREARWPAQ